MEVKIERVVEISTVPLGVYQRMDYTYTWYGNKAVCPICKREVHFTGVGGDGTVIDPCEHYRGMIHGNAQFDEKV
jgi:hypothetical protein